MDWKFVIAQAQLRNNWTQPQLAAHVGCSQALISAISQGKRPEPRYSLGLRLLELANIQPAAPAPAASGIETAAAGQGA